MHESDSKIEATCFIIFLHFCRNCRRTKRQYVKIGAMINAVNFYFSIKLYKWVNVQLDIKNGLVWPWWWSSVHRASHLLWRSEFECRSSLQSFSVKSVFEKKENKQKRPGLAHLKTDWLENRARSSVTRQKSPNRCKSCPNMITLEKWMIFDTFTKIA